MLLKMIQAQWVVEEHNLFRQCGTGLLWFWPVRFPFVCADFNLIPELFGKSKSDPRQDKK